MRNNIAAGLTNNGEQQSMMDDAPDLDQQKGTPSKGYDYKPATKDPNNPFGK